ITMIAKSVIDRHFAHGEKEDLSDIIRDINHDLVREIGMTPNYLTGILLKMGDGFFEYVNAGNVDILLKKGSTGDVYIPKDDDGSFRCSFLGVSSFDCEVSPVSVPFRTGDTVLLYSDGLPECADPQGEVFGQDRLSAVFRSVAPDAPVGVVCSSVIHALQDYTKTRKFNDDCTLIVIKKRNPLREEESYLPGFESAQ
ncbi:MAG: PP2C family protein-serine/threonine phosphatase, partial [Spirochaetota bacterium]